MKERSLKDIQPPNVMINGLMNVHPDNQKSIKKFWKEKAKEFYNQWGLNHLERPVFEIKEIYISIKKNEI